MGEKGVVRRAGIVKGEDVEKVGQGRAGDVYVGVKGLP